MTGAQSAKALSAQLAMVQVPCVCTHEGPGHKAYCPKMRMLRVLASLERLGEGSAGPMSLNDRMVKRGRPEYGVWTWEGGQWRVVFTETETMHDEDAT